MRRAGRSLGAAFLATVSQVMLRLSGRRAGVALMYHRVAPEAGDPSREFVPAISTAQFERHLRHLRRSFRVVSAAELPAAAAARRRGERFPVAVTFDDDTDTHVRHALPCLRRQRVSATFFLNGHALDAPRSYWWEVLQAGRDSAGAWSAVLPAPVLGRAREVAGGDPDPYAVSVAVEELEPANRHALAAQVAEQLGADRISGGGLRADEVRMLAREQTVGFHGARHEPMSLLDDGALASELDDGRAELAAAAGQPLQTIAYPHGRADRRVADAARARGFAVGFTVRAAAVTPGDDPLLLGRVDGATRSMTEFRGALVRALREAR